MCVASPVLKACNLGFRRDGSPPLRCSVVLVVPQRSHTLVSQHRCRRCPNSVRRSPVVLRTPLDINYQYLVAYGGSQNRRRLPRPGEPS